MKVKEISLLLVLALAIYWVFDAYIGWLVITFPIKWVLVYLYFSMLIINVIGIYVYYLIGRDFLDIKRAFRWLEKDGHMQNVLRKSRSLSFIALSILPCPMAGYYFIRKDNSRSFLNVAGIIGLASLPCTLVWGGGLSYAWRLGVFLFFRIQSIHWPIAY